MQKYYIYNNKAFNEFLTIIQSETQPNILLSYTTVEYPSTEVGYIRCFDSNTNTWSEQIEDNRNIIVYNINDSYDTKIITQLGAIPAGYTSIKPTDNISKKFDTTKNEWYLEAGLTYVDYSDIKNKPTIPTKLSELNNDAGFITEYTEADSIYTADKPNLALKSELPGPTDYVRSINGIAPQVQDMGHITLSAADIRTLTGNDVQSSINQLNNRITNIENSSSGSSESSSDITEIEVINGTGSALEVDAKSLEELKSTYLFGPLMDAAIIFPIFDSLPQTLDKACEKTVEIWLQNNFNITTIDFGTSTVINADSIPTQLDPANHVFTVRISYTPDLGAGSADQCIKKIAVNYAYSFDII